MMRTPPVGPFVGGGGRPTDAERRTLVEAYLGYFGTYTVASDSTVVHHVEGGTLPSYIGTDQLRVYRIRGDTLTIGGSRATWPCRILLRVG
jgi:lipocalin-like protein